MNDILDISKIETGQLAIIKSATNIQAVIQQLVELHKAKAEKKNISLTIVFPSLPKSLIIETDTIRFSQIVNNLLSNAIKFTEKGHVEIGYQLSGVEIRFYIKDTGLGVAPENRIRIFERFRQAEPTRDRLFGGTGLGLAISKSLVEMLGGRIWVESKPSEGACFYFTLPLVDSCLPDVKKIEHNEVQNWSKYTVLVAEDEDYNFMYLSEILTKNKINVLRAVNGNEAVTYCRTRPDINLVLMDIKMPGLTGYEAAREILAFRPKLPIIAATAYAMSSEANQSLQCGMVAHLSKPINRDELLNLLKTHLPKE